MVKKGLRLYFPHKFTAALYPYILHFNEFLSVLGSETLFLVASLTLKTLIKELKQSYKTLYNVSRTLDMTFFRKKVRLVVIFDRCR